MPTLDDLALPSLPSDITLGSAGVWAASVLMAAGKERGWSRKDLSGLLLTVFVMLAADDDTDAQIHADMQQMLDRVRGGRAIKS